MNLRTIASFAISALLMSVMCSQECTAVEPSGTLPILHIETENRTPITSKEDYLTATYYLDPCGVEGVESFGTSDAPLPMLIKGRGNYTWAGFDKKPYRLKLDAKASLLGMNKSKHFALMASADDNLAFMRNLVGYELSRRIGMPWTPAAEPVEVVLNGDYIGLYFLTETIRVDPDRVNIVEQADEEVDPEKITGGWLVEIDNYDTDPHVEIQENNSDERIIFTYKTPEILSQSQKDYLLSQVSAMDAAIYDVNKDSKIWESYIDIDKLARFYVVQEIMDDCESFHGSCYMNKNLGNDNKWEFGPVWDFGNAFNREGKSKFIYEDAEFHQTWIGEIAKYPVFQEKVREVWKEFANTEFEGIYDYIDNLTSYMKAAAVADGERWQQYSNAELTQRTETMKNLLKKSVEWLGDKWGTKVPEELPTIYLRGSFNDWGLSNHMTKTDNGIFVIDGIDIESNGNTEFKIADGDWNLVDFGLTENEPFTIGIEYQLSERGKNIVLPHSIRNAKVLFDYNNKTLLITDDRADCVCDIDASEAGFSISGRVLMATLPTQIYNISGTCIWQGEGMVELPRAIYIVKSFNGQTEKLVIR